MCTNVRRIGCTLAALGLAAPLYAARWYVTPNGTGTGTGDWGNACSLQTALANAEPDTNDEIWVAQGTYYPTVIYPVDGATRNKTFRIRAGLKVFGGFVGTEALLPERNPEINLTILDGDFAQTPADLNDNAYHVVYMDSGNARLSGFTIRNGNANGTGNDALGGGILDLNAGGEFNRLRIVNNRALDGGGGFFVVAYNSFEMANVHFERNQVTAGNGGAVLVRPASKSAMQNCTFYLNSCSGRGGALAAESGNMKFHLYNCTFNQNTSGGGGGAIFEDAFNEVELYTMGVYNSIVWGNVGAPQIDSTDAAPNVNVYVQNCDVEDGAWTTPGYSGDGNISANPIFRGSGPTRLSLQRCSPCIEIGANNRLDGDYTDVDDDSNTFEVIPWDRKKVARRFEYSTGTPDAGIVDLGAFEECSISDIDGSGAVDLTDLAMLLNCYGLPNCTGDCCWANIEGDCATDTDIDVSDLAVLLTNYGTSCFPQQEGLVPGGGDSMTTGDHPLTEWLRTATPQQVLDWWNAGMPPIGEGEDQ